MKSPLYRFINLMIVLALALGSFQIASAASANAPLGAAKNYFVDKNNIGKKGCNDTWSGTIDQPLCTVKSGLGRVQPGDTLYIRGGAYPSITVNKSGNSSAYLTISSYNGEKVVISGSFDGIWLAGVSYVKVYGFEIKGANGDFGAGIRVSQKDGVSPLYNIIENNIVHDNLGWGTIGILIEDGSHNLILNNISYNNNFTGIWVSSHVSKSPNGITGNQIIGNQSYNNTASGGNSDGIGLSGVGVKNTLVMNNIVYGNADDGIDTWDTSGNTIVGNIVYGQNGPGDGNGFKLGGTFSGGKNIIKQNISYGNKNNGFDSNGSGGNVFYNNVAYNNGNIGFEDGWKDSPCTSTTCPTTFINNIGYNNARSNLNASESTKVSHNNIWYSTSGSAKVTYKYVPYSTLESFYAASGYRLDNPHDGDLSSIQADPQFVNAPSFVFALQASSPAIDRGDPSNPGLVASKNRVDIGAYELGSGLSPLFADVATNYWAHDNIVKIYELGITGGCQPAPLMYCPEYPVSRAQMAVFLLRGVHGTSYAPPNVDSLFADVVGHWAQDWIDALASDGITAGCGNGNFCPENLVTRAQTSVFLLRAKYGKNYNPPPASGTMFSDVPADYWAASWIEQLAAEGITSGCNSQNFCPDSTITRAQMAVFLVRAFNLP